MWDYISLLHVFQLFISFLPIEMLLQTFLEDEEDDILHIYCTGKVAFITTKQKLLSWTRLCIVFFPPPQEKKIFFSKHNRLSMKKKRSKVRRSSKNLWRKILLIDCGRKFGPFFPLPRKQVSRKSCYLYKRDIKIWKPFSVNLLQ